MSKAKTGGLGRGLQSLFGESVFDPQPESINKEETETEKPEISRDAKAEAKPAQSPGANAAEEKGERVIYVNIADIKPNAKQPRKVFDEQALEELANSILEHGVIQPVLLRPARKGYELVAGERRWRAARKAGLKEIPAIVRDLDERQNAFYALIENMQREDLNAIEEARGMLQMMEEFGLSQEEAAKAVGKSRPYVSNALRLLRLPEKVQDMVESKTLSAGHARAIAGLSGEELQLEAAEKAAAEGWSVRKIEDYTGAKTKKRSKGKRAAKSADIRRIEEQLSENLGTKISIKGSEAKGQIVLDYYSRDELERLIELLSE